MLRRLAVPLRSDAVPRREEIATEEFERAAAFRTALRSFLRRSRAAATAAGLTAERYDLLLMIKTSPHGDEQETIGDLSDRMALQQSAVTELVRRTEEAGLVERRVAEHDARVTLVRLTRAGEERLLDAFVALRRDRQALDDAFTRARRRFDL
jgi:DNA-binding MarR family transcriptional regulator